MSISYAVAVLSSLGDPDGTSHSDKEIMSAIETALWDDSVGNVRKKEYKLGLEWLYRKVTKESGE